MEKFFYPKSIAVAGVSPDEDKNPNTIVSNLMEMGYQGEIFGIGRIPGEIFGIPIYASIGDIKKNVELLVVMVPAADVPMLLKDAGEAGVNRAVIITAGFNELGGDGDLLATQVKEVAKRYSIRFIGPNCQGVICANSGVCVPFAPLTREQIKTGGVSLIAQSGSVGWLGSVTFSHELDGISKIASIGNKLDVNELELLEYLIEDPETRIIAIYLESFSSGRKLCELARKSTKPIIVFKSNISGKGSKLAFSHTAALASDNRIVEGALLQAGILRARSLGEFILMCKAMALPLIKGRNLAVLAASGGMGVIGEDAVQKEHLHLTELPSNILDQIATKGDWKLFNITNPIDIGGFFNNSHIIDAIDLLLSLKDVDGVVFSAFSDGPYCYPFDTSGLVDEVERVSKRRLKPIALNFITDLLRIEQTKKEKGFPIFDSIEDSVFALSAQWKYRKLQDRACSPYRNMVNQKKEVREILFTIDDRTDYYSDLMAMKIASAYGIPCEIPFFATDLEEARLMAAEIGYPVVMKVSSHDISHKTDVGGVKINIKDEAELEKAFNEMMESVKRQLGLVRIRGVMIQRMFEGGMELIFGGKQDFDFGPVIMFGMGGIFVEAFGDVVFRLAPVCREEAHEMVEESKGFPLLRGVRGESAYDLEALADALERFSVLLADFPEVVEMDLNPLKIFEKGKGLIALDGRIRIKRQGI